MPPKKKSAKRKPKEAPTSLADLKPHPRNPRKITEPALAGLACSMTEYGDLSGIVWNKRNGLLVAGHQRIKAVGKAARLDDGAVIAPNGELFPVRVVDWPEDTHLAAMVVANNLHIAGDFIPEAIARLCAELSDTLPAELFAGLDIDKLLEDYRGEPEPGLTDPDNLPEPPEKPRTKLGDLWLLGDADGIAQHRLLCGDSTETGMNEKAGFAGCSCVVYDPPWDMRIPEMVLPITRLVFGDGARIGEMMGRFGAPTWLFAWDCVTSWFAHSRPLRRMKLCAWYGNIKDYDADGAHYGDSGEDKIVTNTRGTYHYVPDPRGKHLADLFVRPITQEHDGPSHSKPLDWMRLLLGNCTRGPIADPFAGSGTTIIAAEQLGRRCYAMEIEPRYVDVAVRRWEDFTGRKAKRQRGPKK